MLRRLPPAWLLLLLAAPTVAQEPKVGSSWYEDKVDLGFKLKAPKDWGFTPGTPLDPNLIGKWAPNNGEGVGLGSNAAVYINVWLVRFDNREKQPKGVPRDIQAWMSGGIEKGLGWSLTEGYPKDLKTKTQVAQCYVFEGNSNEDIRAEANARMQDTESRPVQCYAAVFTLRESLEVALVGIGPGEKKWHGYEKAFEALAKTFEPLALQTPAATAGTEAGADSDPRAQKRAELEKKMARTPGWRMLETENYFIVSNCTDEPFLAEVEERIEAIRKIYMVDYPPEKARAVGDVAGAAAEKPEPGAPDRTVAPKRIDPLAASRSSVVRVCSDEAQYIQYGGKSGQPGYWNSAAEELVLFDDQKGGGRADTWIVLNHEAFHQYIFYFYGSLSPHSWYNEGTGDFYSGYDYEHKKFTLREMPWRIRGIQEALRQGPSKPKAGQEAGTGYAPLKEVVRWSQPEYYGANKYNLTGPDNYAEGWALIYFLRTGEKKKAKGWNPAWGRILDTYLDTLASSGDLGKAVDQAFAGVDWTALEQSWKDYILSL